MKPYTIQRSLQLEIQKLGFSCVLETYPLNTPKPLYLTLRVVNPEVGGLDICIRVKDCAVSALAGDGHTDFEGLSTKFTADLSDPDSIDQLLKWVGEICSPYIAYRKTLSWKASK